MEPIVVFDGGCNLCSHTVHFVVAHESAPTLRFASVQSPAGSRLMRELGFDSNDAKTFILVEHGKAYVRSEAAIRIARHLRRPWRFLGLVRILPPFVRDGVYDIVARNRYRWFGRRETCMVPSPTLAARFLND